MCKNLIMGPAKLIEVCPEGNFKDSITRKRWLGSLSLSLEADSFKLTYSPHGMVQNRWTSSLAQLFPNFFCENKYQEELL